MNKPDSIVKQLSATPKKIFLIDGAGGFLTAFFLLIILARFEEYFGMPGPVIYLLALIGLAYMLYSLACYFFIKSNYLPFLKLIAFANLLYCCLTFGLVCYFYSSLTILGFTYFLLEIGVILFLSIIEYKTHQLLSAST